MMIQNLKSILVGFSRNDRTLPSAFRYALSLAGRAEAHLSVCALSPEITVTHAFVSDVAANLIAEENSRILEIAQDLAEQARQEALTQGVSCTSEVVQDHYSVLASRFAKRARIHDITVYDLEADPISLSRGFLEEALFNGGGPMIIVPPSIDSFRADKVIVAWDGSARAARAVSDALPFLKAAQQVEIVCISGEKDLSKSVAGADLAPQLTRHGITCTVKDLAAKDGDAAEALRSQAGLFRADLVVMGAFVHSRLRQMVLGGVTQSMLKNSTVPLFLSY
jgi:nucleotide-binding universal stress UspA family protein